MLPADGSDLLPMPHGAAEEGGAVRRELREKDRMGNDSWNYFMGKLVNYGKLWIITMDNHHF